MIKKVSTILLWLFAIAIQLQLAYIFTRPKDVVIDIEEVFNEFTMKLELQKKVQSVEQSQKVILDSLEFNLKQIEAKYATASNGDKALIEQEYNRYQYNYTVRKEKMQENLAIALQNFDEQIWSQLNAYLIDFGKEQDVKIIFGNFNKNVLYHDSEMDLTLEAIAFINQRYKGL